ncbi:MAG TPA: TetR/AcrR family transcriptional regulator [Streptosporangiaceae bacterium]|jgi:AcrR family transcriptional regulator|nr:TetR/AcrR family transcriptional regulator [Streptosporangiaceae bacterium]
MPRPGKSGRYHHGDLRAALIDTAVEVIGERGVRGFSLAEASRRAGVAVSAPYAHFADRDDLLAAVTVRAFEKFHAALVPAMDQLTDPDDRLAAMARGYVRFAATHRPLFEVLYEVGLDKTRYPEIKAAEQPVNDVFLACVQALAEGDEVLAEDMATAFEATARGHALLLLDFGVQPDQADIDVAAERAARSTRALIAGRHLLVQPGSRVENEDREPGPRPV